MKASEYADHVMAILSNGTVKVGFWSSTDRDMIRLRIMEQFMDPQPSLEVIVDDISSARLRLVAAPGAPGRVRLGDYRISRVGQSEGADVRSVNEQIAKIGETK